MRFALLTFVLALGATGAAAAAGTRAPPEPDTYIFDLLPLQPYKGSLARLLSGKDTPDWAKAVSTRGEGTAVPGKTVDIAGTRYRLDHVCKPHDCAGNTLDVLWAPAGHKVWAAFVDQGKPPVMLGDPPPPQAAALTAVAAPAAPVAQATAAQAPTSPTPTSPAPAAGAPPAEPAAQTAAAPPSSPATTSAAPSPAPEPDPYIFDVLALQPYKGNFARLVKAKGLPEWVAAIAVKGEGTAVPSRTLDIAGTPYRLDHVCKPHDCAGHTLDVLWAPGGRRVWAALAEGGKPPVMLGKPPAAEAKALTESTAPAAAVAPAAATPSR